jgi:hypothetical protein
MSVFELASLPKLRRIGLVRVSSLTDEAIYSLGDRHQTLERVHLSYCDQITVMAIHYLLQKLQKLNHLSLTGIPAFRRSELQQFCRTPPAVRPAPTSFRCPSTNTLLPGIQHDTTCPILCVCRGWREKATPLPDRPVQQYHRGDESARRRRCGRFSFSGLRA